MTSRIKAWLLRWLGAAPVAELEELRRWHNNFVQHHRAEIAELKTEHDAAITELIQELNELRNNISATAAPQNPKRAVRVFRNFREFRGAIEGRPQQPIQIERTV